MNTLDTGIMATSSTNCSYITLESAKKSDFQHSAVILTKQFFNYFQFIHHFKMVNYSNLLANFTASV